MGKRDKTHILWLHNRSKQNAGGAQEHSEFEEELVLGVVHCQEKVKTDVGLEAWGL